MSGSGRRSARSRTRSTPESDEADTLRSSRLKPKQLHRDRGSRYPGFIRVINANLKLMLSFSLFSFFIMFLLIRHIVKPAEEESEIIRVVTPFPAPKVMDLPQFQGEHRESLYWGTYRPHVYLGIRARTRQSLIAGLMWIGVKEGRYYLRHVCQDHDDLSTYGWRRHNGRDFGYQELVDHGMIITTSFLKSKGQGSGYGGDWAIRLGAQNDKSTWNEKQEGFVHLFFYLADESGNALTVSRDSLDTKAESLLASGSRVDIGGWQLHLKSTDESKIHFAGFKTSHFHNLSELVEENLSVQARNYGRLQLSDSSDDSANVLVFQISAQLPFKADVLLVSGISSKSSRVEERISSLTGDLLTNKFEEKEREFDDKFEKVFPVADKLDTESIYVGKAAIANLLGGIGYFYGQSTIAVPKNSNLKNHDNYISYWPAELYTAVPSRPFFPRGFLWDEGFHQLLIWHWDINISLDIIGHWLDLMNADGWIPREQILGAEALSKVPQEFVPQHSSHGNPPSLILVLRDIVHGLKKNQFSASQRNDISLFLERAFVRLEAWFQWFNTTQSGNQMSSYYWHGRDNTTTHELNPKTLSSGLDDYPRASHPSGDEQHVDLRCWMFLVADCMHSIKDFVKDEIPQKDYGATAELLSDFELLNQMHYDDSYGAYFDFGNHTEKVRLSWKEFGHNHARRELLREVLERPQLRLVPHVGYVSLFPFMAKIIPPDSWILEKQLDLISNKSILWTDYGLRSLAKTSSIYMKHNTEHDPPYWRGAIWMNMNYMILSSLHHYSREDGPYRERVRLVYDELRSNLIRNLVQRFHQSGFLWEQYDPKTGKGQRARLFTGWASLVVLMMGEVYG